jgi:hypothetical protein
MALVIVKKSGRIFMKFTAMLKRTLAQNSINNKGSQELPLFN